MEKGRIDLFVIEKVKRRRLELGVSQAGLADALGMSVGFIGKIESPNYPTHYNLKHLNDIGKSMPIDPHPPMLLDLSSPFFNNPSSPDQNDPLQVLRFKQFY